MEPLPVAPAADGAPAPGAPAPGAPAPGAPDGAPDTSVPVLDVQAILSAAMAARLETRWVHVPEWGGKVAVRELSRGELLRVTKAATEVRTGLVDEAKLQRGLFLTAVTTPRFTVADYELLLHTSSRPVTRILAAIRELIGAPGQDEADGEAGSEGGAVAAAAAAFRAGPRDGV